jgi:type IV pilus assembly protein PilF
MKNNNSGIYIAAIALCVLLLGGCVTETNKRPEQAIDISKALEQHIQLAENYIQKNNRESARHHLRKAFGIDKNSAAATAAMARLYQLEGEPKLAEEYFRRALRRDKSLTQARNQFGSFLYRAKRYEEALVEFEIAASDLDYDNRARVLVNVGRTALKLGNNVRAETVFKHASVLDRGLASPLIELADLSFQQQDYANAKNYLDRYTSVTQATARSLLLGIRIERTFGNKDREASYVLALKNLYPYSREYLEYKQYMSD